LVGFGPFEQYFHSPFMVGRSGWHVPVEGTTMGQVFHQLYYHIVWATKNREPQLIEALRPSLLEAIQDRCSRLGCRVHALNALEDHVHLAIEIPPSRAVSSAVGQLKGASSHAMNQFQPGLLHWQDGYGVLTFRHKELARVVQYIATQEERHRAGALSPLLETWHVVEED
jgi:putative transposase